VKGFSGASGLMGGAVYVLLAFVGFEAAAPLAEEARSPRRTVPRAVLLSCLIVGIFYLFTTLAVAAYVGPARMATYGGLGGGSPWILFGRQLWGWGWVIVFLAIINSFFANGNSALIAATRTWYAMGRISLLPGAFTRTSARHASPVVGILAQTLLTLVIALPLGLHYGPATAFQLLATILSAVMIGIYIVINLSVIGYYARKQRAEFNWLTHAILPVIGAVALLPVLAAAIGVGASWLKFVSPLPYPVSEAGLAVGIWFAIGVIYLVYLAVKHPTRVRNMEEVFD
jgi:amino acid transporter